MFNCFKKMQGFVVVFVLVMALCPTVQAAGEARFLRNVEAIAIEAALQDQEDRSPCVIKLPDGRCLGRAGHLTMLDLNRTLHYNGGGHVAYEALKYYADCYFKIYDAARGK
jgi:hypothetical protein